MSTMNGNSENVNDDYIKNTANGDVEKSKTSEKLSPFKQYKAQSSLQPKFYDSGSDDDDECCVYTYKGDQDDYSFPRIPNNTTRNEGPQCSSPEMDYLEMDFDPTVGQELDWEESQIPPFINNQIPVGESIELNSSKEVVLQENLDENENKLENVKVDFTKLESDPIIQNTLNNEQPCCSKSISSNTYTNQDEVLNNSQLNNINYTSNLKNAKSLLNFCEPAIKKTVQEFENELSLSENKSFCISFCDGDFLNFNDNKLLIELDISSSIKAILTVANIMKINYNTNHQKILLDMIEHKKIVEDTSFVEYFFLRAAQHVNETDISNLASTVFENQLYVNFFYADTVTKSNLIEWLYFWMKKGAIPVVLRNLQEHGLHAPENVISNPWRHDVVCRLEPPWIYFLNNNEKIIDTDLCIQILQPSLIYINREDVIHKWNNNVDLSPLTRADHYCWSKENVLGQIATMIREFDKNQNFTQFIRLPSNCHGGISLFVPYDNKLLQKEIEKSLLEIKVMNDVRVPNLNST